MLSFSPITNSEFERKNPIFENDFETWILIFWAVNVGEITVIYDSLETCFTQVVKRSIQIRESAKDGATAMKNDGSPKKFVIAYSFP